MKQSVIAHPVNTALTNNIYKTARIDMRDIIAFAVMQIKKYYNNCYKLKFFKIEEYIYICLYKGYSLPGVTHHKIN